MSPTEFQEEGVSDTDNTENGDSHSTPEEERVPFVPPARRRFDTELDSSVCLEADEDEKFWKEARKLRRSTCCAEEIQRIFEEKRFSILGQVHLDLCRYHELGRFVDEGQKYDRAAAWFHLEVAAKCTVIEAVVTMAKIFLNIPRELLQDFTVDVS
ncbi:unnamed protein product [Soboliphyme baturini]|uniref:BUB1 N-terminal domain-containing protein n=1 Tax=Soboliphyme baturini TaxID=241478 RepID=A0A183JA27_9BILA|nr:unnamed protein product [Soboliphyme baturini]